MIRRRPDQWPGQPNLPGCGTGDINARDTENPSQAETSARATAAVILKTRTLSHLSLRSENWNVPQFLSTPALHTHWCAEAVVPGLLGQTALSSYLPWPFLSPLTSGRVTV